ncbi:MAG: DUF4159 domain-containing protein, partial [Rhodobacteraceae bacterium]|nr:DUF4159 domain-containing protein [Paracoccaceae bacterium]
MLGALGFTAPWLLLALLALPVLWLILRAIPPAPLRRRFPGVALLLGLSDDDTVTDRTPWWLLALRMLAVAGLIVGLAGPVLNPDPSRQAGRGPVLFLLDGTWAGAPEWPQRAEFLDQALAQAARDGRPVAVARLTTPEPLVFQPAAAWQNQLPSLAPQPWAPDDAALMAWAQDLGDARFDTVWLADGIDYPGREALVARLAARGALRVVQGDTDLQVLLPTRYYEGALQLQVRRLLAGPADTVTVVAHGVDPAGVPLQLAHATLAFDAGATQAQAALSLPAELRARLTRFEIEGQRGAGAVALADDSLQRREVALVAGREDREGLQLLDPLHYLRQALIPSADVLEGALPDLLPANPDVVVLADVASLSGAEQADLLEWVQQGGVLLRFAGPRMAASDLGRTDMDPLLPVRLRAGGRTVGGAMSWGAPKTLAPFDEASPFHGLTIPPDVAVSAQVMAQPDPELAARVIAQLSDGTPLVTRKRIGQGQVVLMHVTANAEWSSLPLSGLFVQMLERLSVTAAAQANMGTQAEGVVWQPRQVLDGFGRLQEAQNLAGVAGGDVLQAPLGPNLRPGLYASEDRRLARNVIGPDTVLTPAAWPASVPVSGFARPAERPLGGWLLALGLVLLAADVLATLAVSGRLAGRGLRVGAVLVLALGLQVPATCAWAQTQPTPNQDAFALAATSELSLAHVLTGDAALDQMAAAGMLGLSDTLFFRTSVEPSAPMGVDLERDDISLFPLLYWPITPQQPTPSAEAYVKLNRYLRSGGMILFDTRDADVAGFGAASPNGRKLRQLAAPLDIPPLEPLPSDHVLTRAFYLLQDFPGRHQGRELWVEAAPADAERAEGMPFRNLNDGVSPVVIGGNDWAAAWATDDRGNPLYPVGRVFSGERQREMALRFGVNLVMHVLTGNYKSDQV